MKITSPRYHAGPTNSSRQTSLDRSCCSDTVCGTAATPLLKRYDFLAAAKSSALDPKYFANQDLQSQAPEAFALMPEAAEFHKAMDNSRERKALAEALKDYPDLQRFDQLTWAQKEPLLRRVFDSECKVLGMTPPELIIQDDVVPGPAFYDFNLDNPDPGKVFLNPKAQDSPGMMKGSGSNVRTRNLNLLHGQLLKRQACLHGANFHGKKRGFHLLFQNCLQGVVFMTGAINRNAVLGQISRCKKRKPLNMIPVGMGKQQMKVGRGLRPGFSKSGQAGAGVQNKRCAIREHDLNTGRVTTHLYCI